MIYSRRVLGYEKQKMKTKDEMNTDRDKMFYNRGKKEALAEVEKIYKKLFCCCSKMDGICRGCDNWDLVKQKIKSLVESKE
jgi:hypothetical protein